MQQSYVYLLTDAFGRRAPKSQRAGDEIENLRRIPPKLEERFATALVCNKKKVQPVANLFLHRQFCQALSSSFWSHLASFCVAGKLRWLRAYKDVLAIFARTPPRCFSKSSCKSVYFCFNLTPPQAFSGAQLPSGCLGTIPWEPRRPPSKKSPAGSGAQPFARILINFFRNVARNASSLVVDNVKRIWEIRAYYVCLRESSKDC